MWTLGQRHGSLDAVTMPSSAGVCLRSGNAEKPVQVPNLRIGDRWPDP